MDANREMAVKIARAVQSYGGRVYYVGGLVRDRLLGKEGKDVDIEVHGVAPELLEAILSSLGECTRMGAGFGIYGLKHYDIDIAMPRREHATGRGHKDFAVFTDPFLGVRKAAERRDFTVNALMEDVLTGEIVDSFGGQEDLKNGILRHVSDASFAEDPLRVLRAAQFAARFGFAVAPETIALCSGMDLKPLARERVMGELEKALLKAEKPSVFFETLRQMHQLEDWFPEAAALIGVAQDPRFHPEGDVWNHTMRVLDCAASLRGEAKEPLAFMLSALCHDFGKPRTSECIDGRIRALGHEEAGVTLTGEFLQRITGEVRLRKYAENMVLLHMRPNLLAAQNSGRKAFAAVYDSSVCPEDLLLLSKADVLGCGAGERNFAREQYLKEQLALYYETMARPFVMGADLVEAGFAPGPDFKEALNYAHKLRLAGVPKAEALAQTEALLRKERKMPKPPKIRGTVSRAVPGDEAILAHIQTTSWRTAFAEILSPEELDRCTNPGKATAMYRRLLSENIGFGYLLRIENEPHCIAWWNAARDEAHAGWAELICIHSLPDHRHEGHGSTMMRRVLKDIKAAGYQKVMLWVFRDNTRARRFYEKHGFTTNEAPKPGILPEEICYEKYL